MAQEKKYKTVATLTPVAKSIEIDASGNHNGAELGHLLVKLLGLNLVMTDSRSGFVTRQHQEYVRGLRDAHVLEANYLYDMLCKHEKVEVVFYDKEVV